jgi:hypothetical protein
MVEKAYEDELYATEGDIQGLDEDVDREKLISLLKKDIDKLSLYL